MERKIPESLKNRRLTEVVIGSYGEPSSIVQNSLEDIDTISDISEWNDTCSEYSTRSTQTTRKTLLEKCEFEDENEKFKNYSKLWNDDQEGFISEIQIVRRVRNIILKLMKAFPCIKFNRENIIEIRPISNNVGHCYRYYKCRG